MLLDADARNSLLALLCRVVYSNPLEAAEDQILRSSVNQVASSQATFRLNWEVFDFMEQEINGFAVANADMRVLKSLLIISGSSDGCFMDSCENYMKWRWPECAEMLFEAMRTGTM